MDLKSYNRWYDYSRARDAMFQATDTNFAPWRVAPSDRKKSVRLNIISDILKSIPYKELPREKLKLPARQKPGDYVEPDYPSRSSRRPTEPVMEPDPARTRAWPSATSPCATGVRCTCAPSRRPTRPSSCRRSSA